MKTETMNLKEGGRDIWEILEGGKGGEKCNYINLKKLKNKTKQKTFENNKLNFKKEFMQEISNKTK